MSSVDNRIVSMKIDNKQFLGGVTSTLSALTKLTMAIKGAGDKNGMENMGKSADGMKTKFGALNTAAMTVVATITNKLVNAGIGLVKSLTLDPIMQGFKEYQTNLTSTQTIMANTGASVQKVGKYLGDLNHYSDQTIYNFSQMADAIGKFTSAGVGLKDATSSIKGMANTAALSGASVEKLNTAMYQMSQALSSGVIRLQDWNSLQQAGMGGENIQKALKSTATTMKDGGKVMDAAIKKHGNFRDSLREGWLTADVYNKTMKVMAGTTNETTGKTEAFSVAQLKAKGYTDEQAKSLHKLSAAAINSATKIKTLPQMMDVIKESVGSLFAGIFENIFGNLTQSIALWTKVGTSVTDVIGAIGVHMDKLLGKWAEMGGRNDLIKGFGNIAQPVIAIFKALGAAWQSVFPPTTAQSLKSFTQSFEDFTAKLRMGPETVAKLTSIFSGLFHILHAGGAIIGLVFHAVFGFFGLFSGGASGGILSVAAAIGRLLAQFDAFVSGKVVDKANTGLDGFFGTMKGLGPAISNIGGMVVNGLKKIGSAIANFFGGLTGFDFGVIFAGAATGGALLGVKKFMDTLDNLFGNAGGMIENIKRTFGALSGSLEAMQANIKAGTLLKIAGAVGIMAASLLVLSMIPAEKLAKGLGAVGSLMLTLVGGLALMAKVNKSFSLVLMATSMDLMAAAILALSVAVAAFGMMDPKTLAQGLAGVAGAILVLVGASALMSKFGGSFIMAATSLTILSIALDLLAATILIYSKISFESLAHGLLGMGAALLIIAGAMTVMPNGVGMLLKAAALNGIAVAITILAGALKILGSMSLEELGKGLGAMAIGLGLIALALFAMQGAMGGAAALIIASAAIAVLTGSLAILGSMSIETLAKGLGALAVGLTLLILAGAGAQVVALGLLALGVAVVMIGTGVGIAAAGIGVLALGLAALGAVGTAAIAVIVMAIKAFLALLPEIAIAGAKAFVAFIVAIGAAAPQIVSSFVKMFSAMLDGANKLLPKILTLVDRILDGLLRLVVRNVPKLAHTFQVLINAGLTVLRNSIPKMAATGLAIIEAVLKAISNRIPRIVTLAGDIVVKFINGISNNLGRIITAGTNLIIKFIVGVGNAAGKIVDAAGKTILKFLNAVDASVKRYSGQIGAAGRQIGYDLVNGLTGGLLGWGIGKVQSAVAALANAIPGPIKKILGIASPSKVMIGLGQWVGAGLVNGISGTHKAVANSASGLAQASIDAAKTALDIHSPSGVFKSLGINVSKGFVNGIIGSLNIVKDAGVQMAKDTVDTVTRTTTDLQLKADAQAAKADAIRFQAAIVRQKLHNKNLTKVQKAHINAQAKALDKRSADYASASAATQSGVDAVNKREDDARAFDAADTQGRADILNTRAQEAAAASEASRKNAIKLAEEAQRIRTLDAKRAKALSKQASVALKNAESAANQARTLALQAQQYAIQAVITSSGSVANDLNSWLAQEEADKAYEAMTVEQQKAEMERRAAEDQKTSDSLIQSARDKLAQANALASTNAQAAQLLVASAGADVEAAKAAKDRAQSEADTAAGLVADAVGAVASGTTTGSGVDAKALADALKMPDTNISSSSVFGAQNMFDAYAKALATTSSAAEADKAGGITFVQHNTSPEALSPSEVYRQSKNLLSNAERKLAGAL